MDIKIYTYELIDAKMYLLIEDNAAIVIDPHINEDIFTQFPHLKIEKILLTHEHYDHISGVNWLKEKFDCDVVCSDLCSRNILSELRNGSKYFNVLFLNKDEQSKKEADQVQPMTCTADITFSDESEFYWKGHLVNMRSTPGHSEGSCCITVDDKHLFTGDSLLKDIPVITRLPGGNRKAYEEITVEYLRSLPGTLYAYPGHGEGGFLETFRI